MSAAERCTQVAQTAMEVIELIESKHADKVEQLATCGVALCAMAKLQNWSIQDVVQALRGGWDDVTVGEVSVKR